MPARRFFGPAPAGRGRAIRSLAIRLPLAAAAALAISAPAAAQVAATIAAESDFRFRGSSLSGGRAVATAQAAYDHGSGFYLNTSATGVHREGHAALLNLLGNVGFAKRLTPSLSVDTGLVHSRYRWGDLPNPSSERTEAYVGLVLKDVAARLSYSPHYFERGMAMLYGEVEGGFQPLEHWRVSARGGVLTFLRAPGDLDGSSRYDWRVGVSRQFGAVEINTAFSGGGPDRGTHGATAITVGASLNF